MDSLDTNLVELLSRDDAKSFEHGLAQLRDWRRTADEEQALGSALEVLQAFNNRDSLPALERSRRTQLVLEALAINKGLPRLAQAARDWNAEVKITVARFLPPPLRRLVYGGTPSTPAAPARMPSPESQQKDVMQSDRSAMMADLPHFRTVLLLGAQQDHEFNDQHLRRHEFDPLRVDRPEQLPELLDETVCGVVIAKSWWVMLPAEDHRSFLEMILKHSTFTWVKMDQTGFRCNPPITLQELYRSIRFSDVLQLAVGDTGRVTEYDIDSFREAGRFISTSLNVQLAPGDVRAEEGNVLLAATAHCVHARHFPGRFQLERVPVGLVTGGRSDAKIFRVEPDDGGVPFIAKIDEIQKLRDEMERFCRFVRPWDDRLKPCLHFHTGKGVIVFTLVDNPDCPGQPAPTLEDRLCATMFGELSTTGHTPPQECDLTVSIVRTVEKLTRLNSQPCQDQSVSSFQWLDIEGLDGMIQRGVAWAIPAGPDGRKDALHARYEAIKIAKRLLHNATIHGDVHLRNILVRDDREPYFIDYAYSGPGHPCFDLVRFESALFYQFFRLTADEHAVKDLVATLLRDDPDEADVQKKFLGLLSSVGNRLAIKAMILSRRACMQILQKYNGNLQDYIAVRYIVACQSLTLPHLQTGVIRGAISALAELFL